MRRMIVLPLLVAGCLSGCSVINTGPEVVKTSGEIAAGGAKALFSAYQPVQMSADISADVNDPTYWSELFVGSGIYTRFSMGVKSAELRASIDSTGHGVEIPLEVRTEALEIIGNEMMSETERRDRLSKLFLEFMFRDKPVAVDGATTD